MAENEEKNVQFLAVLRLSFSPYKYIVNILVFPKFKMVVKSGLHIYKYIVNILVFHMGSLV